MLASLSGCSQPEADDSGPKTLTVWYPGAQNKVLADQFVPQFEKEAGVKVELTFVDWTDMSPKLNAAFAAGSAPDVFGHGPAAAADFAANDRILDLDDYVKKMSETDRKDLAGALPGGQVDGKQYLMPLSLQGSLIVYDADAFREAGINPDTPPETWDEARAVAEKLTKRDQSGQITRSGLLLPSAAVTREQSFLTLLSGKGGSLLNKEGTEATLNSTEGVAALEFFAGLYTGQNAVSANLGQDYSALPPAQQPIVQGTAAMTELPAGSGAVASVLKAAPGRDLRIMPALSFDSKSPAAFGGAGPGLMINKDSKAADLAWKFIAYMMSAEVSTEYTKAAGAMPVRASAQDSDYAKNSPLVKTFLSQAEHFVPNPNVVGWVQIRDELDKHLEQALNQRVSAKDALQGAADKINKMLKSNR